MRDARDALLLHSLMSITALSLSSLLYLATF